jgi:hypothetical protein
LRRGSADAPLRAKGLGDGAGAGQVGERTDRRDIDESL